MYRVELDHVLAGLVSSGLVNTYCRWQIIVWTFYIVIDIYPTI